MRSKLYVYSLVDNTVAAIILGDQPRCESHAALLYGSNDYGWTYAPGLGLIGGLEINRDTVEIDVDQHPRSNDMIDLTNAILSLEAAITESRAKRAIDTILATQDIDGLVKTSIPSKTIGDILAQEHSEQRCWGLVSRAIADHIDLLREVA